MSRSNASLEQRGWRKGRLSDFVEMKVHYSLMKGGMTLELIKKTIAPTTSPGNMVVFLVSERGTLAGICVGTALAGCIHSRAVSNRSGDRIQKQAKSYGMTVPSQWAWILNIKSKRNISLKLQRNFLPKS